jgi:hypothetical protein
MIKATAKEQEWLDRIVAQCQAISDAAAIVQEAMYAEARAARDAARTARESEGWEHWHTAKMKRDAVDQAGDHAYRAVIRRHIKEDIAQQDRERAEYRERQRTADRLIYC